MMKRILSIMMFVALTVTNINAYEYKTVPGDPMAMREYTLPNGLKVFLSVNKETPRVTAHIAVNTGSRNDPAETTGLAHYLEHLMFKGSKQFGTTNYAAEKPYLDQISSLYEEYRKLTDVNERKAKYREIDSISQIAAKYFIPNEYDKMMTAIGSVGTNAFTSNDVTCYVENIPSNEIERWAMVNADRFQNLVMRGFHTELEAVYEEKNISMTKDRNKAYNAMLFKTFPKHPYGTQSTIGTQEHLKNPSQVNIRNYYNKYYVPNNVAICMAGDLDPDATIALIDKYFGSWKPGTDCKAPVFPAMEPITSPQDTTVVGQETENIMLGWRLKGAADLQNDTITMVDMLLSNGDVGLIDLDLNQKMKVLGAGSGIWDLKDYSMFLMAGTPNEGQSLDEVRALMLGEIEKIKRGDWDEKLIKSIVANWRLSELKGLDDNKNRVSQMVDCFILGRPWQQNVQLCDRLEKLTKADIMRWASEHLGDGYVAVYKKKGEDSTIVKIDKPEITAIPSNRDLKSAFLENFNTMTVEPIHPVFVDFQKDVTFGNTKKGLPVLYCQNTQDDRFNLVYRFDFGELADQRYDIASSYYDLLGTNKKSAEQIKRDFYDIACSFDVSVGDKTTSIVLSGLQKNMPKAVAMLDNYLSNLKPDTAVYNQLIDQVKKSRMEARTNQSNCYGALVAYGIYGPVNPYTNVPTIEQLKEYDPSVFTDLLKGINGIKHQVLYWGPATLNELSAIISKNHKTPKHLTEAPKNKSYEKLPTTKNEIFLAPYDAKNINMRMISSELKPLDVQKEPIVSIFNEYFGGSMNAIVFQELREARGLAYNANAAYVTPSRKGETDYYQQHIISQNDKMMDCIRVFKEITDSMPQNDANFKAAQQSIMKNICASRSTKAGPINGYLYAKELGIDYDINRLYYDVIPTLTLQDIVKFEEENIKGKPIKYLILGNEKELDMESLEKIAPVQRLTLDEIFPK
ncbi:MAG: insulinase family protein [Prevotella sp.]|nr:insulinase family protein [Candidatus Prevotella equi]